MVELAVGNYEIAATRLLSALQMSTALAFTNNVLAVLRGLARILVQRGETETALRALRYVADHPSSTPFSRAVAGSEFSEIVARTGAPVPGASPSLDAIGMAGLAAEVASAVQSAPGHLGEYARAEALAHAPHFERAAGPARAHAVA
jgi:hypothetical protein